MQYIYTAVIFEEDGTFYAKVPDVKGCITTASSLWKIFDMVSDALNLCLVALEDEGITPNPPTLQRDIPHGENDILALVRADTGKYRSEVLS